MTKNEIVNYVVETPHNVNKNILGQKLDEFQKNVSWNDLKDKPFSAEIVEKIFEHNPDQANMIILDDFPLFAIGDEVALKIDGVKYSLVAFEDQGAPSIGDSWLDIENEVEQFGWRVWIEDFVYFRSNNPHTISYQVETIHKVDAKYLPEGLPHTDLKVVIEKKAYQFEQHEYESVCYFPELDLRKYEELLITFCGRTYRGKILADMAGIRYVQAEGGAPFELVHYYEDGEDARFSTFDSSDDGQFEVGIMVEVVHKLDAKYLPYDFVIKEILEGEDCSYQMLSGDFGTARAKFEKDLPVTVLILTRQNGGTQKNFVEYASLFDDNTVFGVNADWNTIAILSDNTVVID